MLRSDKAATWIVIGFALLLAVASIVGVVLALTGDVKEEPAYKRQAAPALVRMPDDSIVKLGNASRPPISDRTYEILHVVTRTLANDIVDGSWRSSLIDNGVQPSVRQKVTKDIQLVREYVRSLNQRQTRDPSITIGRPVGGKTRTGITLTYVGSGSEGQAVAPVTVVFDLYWQLNRQTWEIVDLQIRSSGGQSTEATGSDTGDGGATATEEDDPTSSEDEQPVDDFVGE